MPSLIRRNLFLVRLFTAVCILLIAGLPAFGQVSIPETPVGKTLNAFLDSFNSGDRSKIEAFVKDYDPTDTAEMLAGFRNQTGGFQLLSIEHSSPGSILFRVKGRGDNIDAVDEHARHGDYNSMTDGTEFADALTRDLRAVSHDKHLFIDWKPFKSPAGENEPGPHPPSDAEKARFRAQVEHDNCTFSKVEILPGNIGYVKFGAFVSPDICGPTVTAAITFVSHADAVIFDMRENHGGDPSMVEVVVSYLFDDQTHINDLVNRHDNETRQYWTLPYLPGPRLGGKPIYVLTSGETFSGAEEFTYDLKTQKRATIVGETTGGGAHPMDGMPLGDHFTIGVPVGRPVNPITKTDWEGIGVTPDVKVSAADALSTAQKLATEKVAAEKNTPEKLQGK